jgi:prepilin-type N-terminal cleavage/methylation domain-containing protein
MGLNSQKCDAVKPDQDCLTQLISGLGCGFSNSRQSTSLVNQTGFTLLESLVLVLIIGILASIAAPSWLAFWHNQKLATAQGQVVEVLHKTQETAKQKRLKQQASFRTQNGRVQWAIHAVNADVNNVSWNSLESGIQIDSESTLQLSNSIYQVQFNHQGETNGQLGRLTLSITSSPMMKRCVFVASLLGAIRTGQTQPRPNSGKFCY